MWSKVLLKNVNGSKFQNSRTIDFADKDKKFQIFEVLVTETLAVIDPATKWRSLPVSGDDGVDFIGEREELRTPYLLQRPGEIILGQIKRRANGYRKDYFHYDIVKIIEYYNDNYAPQKTLFQIVHVLSVDHQVDPRRWLENASYPYQQYHITPLNAMDFFRLWRVKQDFLVRLLEGVCSQKEIDSLLGDLSTLREDWTGLVKAEISVPPSTYLGDTFSCELKVSTDIDLTLNLYAVWEPAQPEYASPVILVYPHNMLRESGYRFHIPLYKCASIGIKMRVQCAGAHDLGKLCLYSEAGEHITSLSLGQITVYPGIVSNFYDAPFQPTLDHLRREIAEKNDQKVKLWAIVGQGGIGKTTLSNELMLLAMNRGYYIVSVQCQNELSSGRQPVLDLIAQLIRPEHNELYVYEKLFELLRDFLNTNFQPQWAKPVMNYIMGEKNVVFTPIIECFMTLLLMICSKAPTFIWISDMHWASKDVIIFFQAIIAAARYNSAFFSNPLVLIFEGRDNEALMSEHKAVFPYEWLQFLSTNGLTTFHLDTWKSEHSGEFVEMLIAPRNGITRRNRRLLQLKELVLRYSNGNPMHIKEYLRYLIDQKAIQVQSDGAMELTDYGTALSLKDYSIQDVVLARICFYREKYPEIIDCYIILANVSTNRRSLYRYMSAHFFSKYVDYYMLEKEISMLNGSGNDVVFLHEYYEYVLKKQKISDPLLLSKILFYFENSVMDENDEAENMDAIIMRLLQPAPDNALIAPMLLELLCHPASDSIAFQCYKMLLDMPKRFWEKEIGLSEIYFNMSEIAIRISSWRNSRQYLEQIIELPQKTELDRLYNILALKSLGNICGVSLELEKSISFCQQGLEAAKQVLESPCNNPKLQNEFCRQYEMLLNRIAVTYWFMGRCDLSAPYQEEALCCAKARADTYSIAHTLYETGIRMLHTDIAGGKEKIQVALEMLPPHSKFSEPQERLLVETELLIARIVAYASKREQSEILDIYKACETLCKTFKVETANYEAALCYIVYGISCIELGNVVDAIKYFYSSMDIAQIGAFETVLWKVYLNLAQAYDILDAGSGDYQEQITRYGTLALNLINTSLERNANLPSYLALMRLSVNQANQLLGITGCTENDPSAQQPLHINYGKYRFFIMD